MPDHGTYAMEAEPTALDNDGPCEQDAPDQNQLPVGSPIRELVYILSPSFSGSTLLTFLLGTHPEISTIGELKATAMGDVDEYSCSCGQCIRQCPFWQQVTDLLRIRGIRFDVGQFGTHYSDAASRWRHRLLRTRVRGRALETLRDLLIAVHPPARKTVARIMSRNVRIAEAVATLQGGPVFLDGAKDPVRLRFWLRRGPWPIKVISLVRDGRATTNSFMRHYDLPVERAAHQWRASQEECEAALRFVTADRCLRVKYEDLCSDPDEVMGKIWRFLCLDPALAERDFRNVEHHIIGNSMRLDSSAEIRLDDRWRTVLGEEEVRTIERVAGRVNRRNGYCS